MVELVIKTHFQGQRFDNTINTMIVDFPLQYLAFFTISNIIRSFYNSLITVMLRTIV